MSKVYNFHYTVDGKDFISAGNASVQLKKNLTNLGVDPEIIRRVAIAMYEGEINMVIHAGGGKADVTVTENYIEILLSDNGPGIKDVNKAMREGFSTANEDILSLGFGAGMGLPNMKKYTDCLEVQSEVGKGTSIKMRVNL